MPGRLACAVGATPARRQPGFTLMEMMVAITIVAIVLAVSVPASVRFYDSIQYRSAVREVVSLLSAGRYLAINSGRAQDVTINPQTNELRLQQRVELLPAKLNITVHSARELNERESGVIRFYPGGGSSGGGVDIENPAGGGVRISVDWLMGSVNQEKYAYE